MSVPVGSYLSAFNDAAMEGNLVKMRELRSQYPEVNLDYPLILAAQEGHLEMIKYLVKEGGNPRAQADQALFRAATEGHLGVVAYLLSLGADVNAGDNMPLLNAAYEGHLDVLKLLRQHTSASVEFTATQLSVMRYLLDTGADVTVDRVPSTPEGEEALECLVDIRGSEGILNPEIIRFLEKRASTATIERGMLGTRLSQNLASMISNYY